MKKDKNTGSPSLKPMTVEEIERFRNMKDEDIDTSDIPELDERFWELAEVLKPQKKTAISLRLDNHILGWFKHQGPGYQSRINAALKAYVASQRLKEKRN